MLLGYCKALHAYMAIFLDLRWLYTARWPTLLDNLLVGRATHTFFPRATRKFCPLVHHRFSPLHSLSAAFYEVLPTMPHYTRTSALSKSPPHPWPQT